MESSDKLSWKIKGSEKYGLEKSCILQMSERFHLVRRFLFEGSTVLKKLEQKALNPKHILQECLINLLERTVKF